MRENARERVRVSARVYVCLCVRGTPRAGGRLDRQDKAMIEANADRQDSVRVHAKTVSAKISQKVLMKARFAKFDSRTNS